MQTITNRPFLEERSKYARWGSYVGFGALLLGMLTTMRYTLLSYVFLLVGLLGASIGSYLASRYVKQPRADQLLAQAMDSLDDRYTLYNYHLPAHHVVASHRGLTVLEPRSQKGEIHYQNGHWRHKAGFRKVLQFFGEPSLGKPDQDLERNITLMEKWVAEHVSDIDAPVNGVIVFTDPDAELQIKDPPYPAVKAQDLSEQLTKGLEGEGLLSTSDQKRLKRIIDEVTKRE